MRGATASAPARVRGCWWGSLRRQNLYLNPNPRTVGINLRDTKVCTNKENKKELVTSAVRDEACVGEAPMAVARTPGIWLPKPDGEGTLKGKARRQCRGTGHN